jgi:CbiX
MTRNLILLMSLVCLALNVVRGQTAVVPHAQESPRIGVLLLAHGGHVQTWNEEVRHVADQVDLTIPTEVAFGMATKSTMQESINRLIARGVTEIVAVPLFVSSHSSVIDGTAYLLSLRTRAPDDLKDFAAMDHGNGMNQASMNHDPSAAADAMRPVTSSVPIRMSSALDHDANVADILIDRAASISKDPAREVVILVAHGPVPEEDNKLWLNDAQALRIRRHRLPHTTRRRRRSRESCRNPAAPANRQGHCPSGKHASSRPFASLLWWDRRRSEKAFVRPGFQDAGTSPTARPAYRGLGHCAG